MNIHLFVISVIKKLLVFNFYGRYIIHDFTYVFRSIKAKKELISGLYTFQYYFHTLIL